MFSAPGITLLPVEERSLFLEAFAKELDFLQMLLLLVNRTFPFKNVDLIWADAVTAGRVTLRQGTGTTQALHNPHLRRLHGIPANPNPEFCSLVSDQGRRDAETCLMSDRAAAERARQSGRIQVYRCHAGIMDIAVPVRSGNHYLATLHCGQCLREPPSEEGFARVRRSVAGLAHIDPAELKRAYYELPVVSREELAGATEVLEMFAEYLGRLWERLRNAVRVERQKLRQIDLLRTEFAHLMLEGGEEDRARVRGMMKRLGFSRYPNRVLVVRLEQAPSFDMALTRALHAITELSERSRDTAVGYLRQYGICVFFHNDPENSPLPARRLAQKVQYAVAERAGARARVGIGSVVKSWRRLPESYQEARQALAGSPEPVAVYSKSVVKLTAVNREMEAICGLLAERRLEDSGTRLRAFPALVERHVGAGPEALHIARHVLGSALEAFSFTAQRMGCEEPGMARLRAESEADLEQAATLPALEESYARGGAAILDEVQRLHFGKHEKIAERARRMIEQSLERGTAGEPLSLESVAAELGVSTGHLSRLFTRVTGLPFRPFVMQRRVERAKRLLLEPLNNVVQVAESCGYANPAYFARVFRKLVGCSPSEYAKHPPAR